ncbi:MAG: hypothetical protein K1X57_14070 [Gemmataceae bacterium]|nr:hypothetical protein [Gemmataceae bacterium]
MDRTRRDFLDDVGRGMLVAGIGPSLAADLGLASARADDAPGRLRFGSLEPLVGLMQETPPDQLQPRLVQRLKAGTELRELVSAAALANARALGGHDYDGYHTFMALGPAWEMARDLPTERRALPVLKVIYRNASVIQKYNGGREDVLHEVAPQGGAGFREAVHQGDLARADRAFVALARKSLPAAYDDLQTVVQDEVDVHRVVLAWRAWSMLDVAGREQADTFLRQSVHYCVNREKNYKPGQARSRVRVVLPKMLDKYKLVGKPTGTKRADDGWIEQMCMTIFGGSPEQAAEAVAAALAEGFAPDSVAEAICLAANRLVLCDRGRAEPSGKKAKDSVHGDSPGVHASDAANAWRNIARVASPRNAIASLIVGAYHTAGQANGMLAEPYPTAAHRDAVTLTDPAALRQETAAAIEAKDQARASAVVHRYGELGHPDRPMMDVLLRYAISEDGALHAEKYYRTVFEEFAATRPAFRWRQIVALARVTASAYGQPAPGYAEACGLLKL